MRLILLVLLLACGGCSRAPRIELAMPTKGEPHFEVVGLDAVELAAFEKLDGPARNKVLSAHVVSDLPDPPSLSGASAVVGDRLVFTPRYPLEPGVSYRVVLRREELSNSSQAGGDIAVVFEVRRQVRRPTTMAHIYPTSIQLPENQLKFYIHFSAPMSRGEAYRRVHLLDGAGKEVEGAFLELGEELWNPEQTRFTLLCDPGRVKRGLKPREELGPVLREGGRYTLVVDRNWRDADGEELAMEMRREYLVGAPDETPIDTKTWKIEPPESATDDALVVRFPEPLDHSLLGRMLWVVDAAGERVEGEVDVDHGETRWCFTPVSRWKPGKYRLVVDTALEDLAGNAIGRPFEVDEFRAVQQSTQSETVELPFAVVE